MEPSTDIRNHRGLLAGSRLLGGLLALLGILALVGWHWDIEFLKRPVVGTVAMNPVTALCFVLCGMALVMDTAQGFGHTVRPIVAATVVVIAGVKLVALATGSDSTLDALLYASKLDGEIGQMGRNRMAPNTAFCFLLAGTSLLLYCLAGDRQNRMTLWAEILAIALFLLAVVPLLGYAYEIKEFYGVMDFIPMAVHTALGHVMLATAIFFAHPHGRFMSSLTGPLSGSYALRLLLPFALLAPVGLGFLRISGQRAGLFTPEFGTMMHVTLEIVILVLLIWKVAIATNSNETQKLAAEQAMAELNAHLESMVRDRTAALEKSMVKLEESGKRFRHALDNMLEGIQIIDHDWRYAYVNRAVTAHARLGVEQLLGRTMMECYPGFEETKVYGLIHQCMEQGASFHFENEFVFPDGEVAYFDMSIQPVPQGVFILSIETTQRKKADLKVREFNEQLERTVEERTAQLQVVNKELEAFSYSVSHDLRAPLRAVNGFSEMVQLQYGPQLDDNGRRLLNIIRDNAVTMGQLIDDLLEFSRTGRKEMVFSKVDMQQLAQEALTELTQQDPAKTEAVTIHALPVVSGDRQSLKQVLINLISNALKYSSKKKNPEILLWSTEEDDSVVFHIRDNGAGFDMAYSDKLFGVFQRLHSKREFDGTGVGLALVQRIVTRHCGRVWAEAEVGKGATFHFTIPQVTPNDVI